MVDGTIIVVRSAETTYDALHRGMKHFNDIQSKILGVIINGADMKKPDYQYYSQYAYYYSSEDKDPQDG
jgi:Mrp family chromosome partitioning ATPase